jgi:hypothetical protein
MHIKKYLLLVITLVLPAAGQAQFDYVTNDNTITITGYTGPGGAVTIPGTITDLSVASIGAYAFSGTSPTSVTIPNSVTNIGDYAFVNCSTLAGVTFGNGIISIGDGAFWGCGLTNVTLPNSVTSLGNSAFRYCIRLSNIILPNSITSINTGTFIDCPSLASVSIPTSVTSIGYGAFYNCTGLVSAVISNGVTYIGTYAFDACSSLTGVYFTGNAPDFGSDVFTDATNVTVYYLPEAAGWTNTFAGRPTALWTFPPAVTNQPQSLAITAGDPAGFSVTATGTDPLSYQWRKNGGELTDATNASHSIACAWVADAGNYDVVITNSYGSVTSSVAVLTVNKAAASVTLSNLAHIYDGTARNAAAATTPPGLTVDLTYDGSSNAPTNAGSYEVIGTVNNPNYQGSTTNSLVIAKADATIMVSGFTNAYDGVAHGASGSANGVNAEDLTSLLNLGASYTDVPGGTADWSFAGNANYHATNGSVAIEITQANASVSLDNLNQTYNGTARSVSASTTPTGLTVALTYDGSPNAPTNAGSYEVIGTVNNPNYQGSTTNSLIIAKADAVIAVSGYTNVYDGAAHGASGSATGVNSEDLSSLLSLGASYTDVPGGIADWSFAGNANYHATNRSVAIEITQANASVSLDNLNQTYNGTARSVSASTTPTGLTVALTYDGSPNAPTNAGSYEVIGAVNNPNYQGSTTNSLVIAKAGAAIMVSGYTNVYDGAAEPGSELYRRAGRHRRLEFCRQCQLPCHQRQRGHRDYPGQRLRLTG